MDFGEQSTFSGAKIFDIGYFAHFFMDGDEIWQH